MSQLRRPRTLASTLALVVAASLLSPAPGRAQPTGPPACPTRSATLTVPFIGVLINGECTDLSAAVRRLDITELRWGAHIDQVIGNSRIVLDATLDYDPFITFGATTTNLIAGPITYSFLFGTPILPGLYNTATSSLGGSITLGQSASASVSAPGTYPTFLSGYGTVGLVPTNLGVDIGTGTCTATTATPTQTCGPFGPGASAFGPTFYDNLEALLTYQQTGLSSAAGFTGRVELLNTPTSTVPEPATVALLAVGLAGTGLVARRRRTR